MVRNVIKLMNVDGKERHNHLKMKIKNITRKNKVARIKHFASPKCFKKLYTQSSSK